MHPRLATSQGPSNKKTTSARADPPPSSDDGGSGGNRSDPADYAYNAPATSPFYDKLLSPACDWICLRLVPIWVHPDHLTLCGLGCAVLSCVFAFAGSFLWASLLWVFYSFFDNLDGKQARRLQLSSAGGEFLDHSCDAVVVTLSAVLWMHCAVENRMHRWKPILLFLGAQLPYYVATWAHHSLGRLLLGSVVSGTDYFTVDEFNVLFLPGVCLLRYLSNVWEFRVDNYLVSFGVPERMLSYLTFLNDNGEREMTMGMVLAIAMCVYSAVKCYRILRILLSLNNMPLFLPIVAYAVVVTVLVPSALTALAPYALLNMELIARRLQKRIDVIDCGASFWVCCVGHILPLIFATWWCPHGSRCHGQSNVFLWVLLAFLMTCYRFQIISLYTKAAKEKR